MKNSDNLNTVSFFLPVKDNVLAAFESSQATVDAVIGPSEFWILRQIVASGYY
jgi:hypothetical protein